MANTRSNFSISDKHFQSGLWERVAQNTRGFNEASAGAIVMVSDMLKGNYEKTAFFDLLSDDAIVHRDPNDITDAAIVDLGQSELISVNIPQRLGPIDKTLDAWYQIESDPDQLGFLVGQMSANLKAKKMLNKALLALTAALRGQAALKHDVTNQSVPTLTLGNMANGLRRIGDAYANLAAWVMHSTSYFDLVGNQIADKMDSVAGVIVYGGTPATMGKPVVVTDSPSLINDAGSTTESYNVLGLTQGAVIVKDSEQAPVVSEIITGKKNLVGRIQSEFVMNIGCKGFAWNTGAGGGANPTDATLGTSSNWTKVVDSHKDCGGFVIEVLAD